MDALKKILNNFCSSFKVCSKQIVTKGILMNVTLAAAQVDPSSVYFNGSFRTMMINKYLFNKEIIPFTAIAQYYLCHENPIPFVAKECTDDQLPDSKSSLNELFDRVLYAHKERMEAGHQTARCFESKINNEFCKTLKAINEMKLTSHPGQKIIDEATTQNTIQKAFLLTMEKDFDTAVIFVKNCLKDNPNKDCDGFSPKWMFRQLLNSNYPKAYEAYEKSDTFKKHLSANWIFQELLIRDPQLAAQSAIRCNTDMNCEILLPEKAFMDLLEKNAKVAEDFALACNSKNIGLNEVTVFEELFRRTPDVAFSYLLSLGQDKLFVGNLYMMLQGRRSSILPDFTAECFKRDLFRFNPDWIFESLVNHRGLNAGAEFAKYCISNNRADPHFALRAFDTIFARDKPLAYSITADCFKLETRQMCAEIFKKHVQANRYHRFAG